MQITQNTITQNPNNAIMQNSITLKHKRNRNPKRETRESFREYTYTMLTMTPYAGFNALHPLVPELKFVTGPFFNKRPFANFGRL